jgi:hypothetical protein
MNCLGVTGDADKLCPCDDVFCVWLKQTFACLVLFSNFEKAKQNKTKQNTSQQSTSYRTRNDGTKVPSRSDRELPSDRTSVLTSQLLPSTALVLAITMV